MLRFLDGGGDMGAAIRAFDWMRTALGAPATWSTSLKALTGVLLDAKQPMFIVWGSEQLLLYNDGYAAVLAGKHPEALGRPFLDVWAEIRPDLLPIVQQAYAGTAVHMDDITLVMERRGFREETHFAFSYTPIRGDDGNVEGFFCACTEITDQVFADRRSAAEREGLFKLSRDLFTVASFDGFLKSVNPAWSRLLGRSDEELLAQPFAEIVHPDDLAATADVVAQLSSGQPVHQFYVRLLKADGEAVQFAWSAVPDETPGSNTFYSVGRDISEELRRKEMLRQSQKMEAVGQLTGGLAHDFNNLLAGISGSLELITMRLAQGRVAEVEKYATAAQGAASRAAALTHRLLAFSRRQTLAPKPTDVKQLVSGMADLIGRTIGPDIELETVNAVGLWPSLIDPSQLKNAILNLCINARDAMPDGGKITIETGNRWFDQRTAKERGVEPGQYISLCVSDTGTGMPPEVIARAFDPFFTTKPIGVGTGLGLSMIYGFAQQSGGAVSIYSELDQGSIVCIYLPRYRGEAEEDELLEPSAAPRGDGETVLIIDDEPTVRMLVSEVLSDLGYNALEAEDGAAGLKILNSGTRIDLLVTDVGLPGGLNGRQVADAARASRPGLKVLFITGYAENAVLSHGHLDPGMHVMTKPFAMDALATRIRELIEA
jgi:PAS domain S-box-containing protein